MALMVIQSGLVVILSAFLVVFVGIFVLLKCANGCFCSGYQYVIVGVLSNRFEWCLI